MAMPGMPGYKPSPLGFGSPRASPFRRPGSPSSSPLRQTPTTQKSAASTPGPSLATPPRFGGSAATPSPAASSTWAARNLHASPPPETGGSRANPFGAAPLRPISQSPVQARVPAGGRAPSPGVLSPGRKSPAGLAGPASPPFRAPSPNAALPATSITALAQLQPAQVRTLREAFQILDRDGDGSVGRDDVADMLGQLGLPAGPGDMAAYFATAPTMTMGAFVNALAGGLAAMSPAPELLSALSAFDEDDSGQVDLGELRDALLHTAPEAGERALTEAEINHVMAGFTGRRAFAGTSSKSKAFGKRGDVFRYQEFVQSIAGKAQAASDE